MEGRASEEYQIVRKNAAPPKTLALDEPQEQTASLRLFLRPRNYAELAALTGGEQSWGD
jgi:hypothetical protein